MHETVFNERLEVSYLGVLAVRAAKHELEVIKRRIRICSCTIYSLGFLVLASGIYAAVIGLKLEGDGA